MVHIIERFTRRDALALVNRSPEMYSSLASLHIVDDVLAGESVARLLDGAKPMVVGGARIFVDGTTMSAPAILPITTPGCMLYLRSGAAVHPLQDSAV